MESPTVLLYFRRERYDNKKRLAKDYSISLGRINFKHGNNFRFIVCSATYFGPAGVHVT